MKVRTTWRGMFVYAASLAGLAAILSAGAAAAQEGTGQSGTLSGDGLVLEWRVSGADVGPRAKVDGTWLANGAIVGSAVRFSGVIRATSPPDRSIDVSMAASISVAAGGGRSEVRWSGELGKAAGPSHELPFDLTIQSEPRGPLALSASVSRMDNPSGALGVRLDLAPGK